MITPEYSKAYNCPVCGWRHCPGCDEPPEPDDGFDYDPHAPEALGWTPASTEELYALPKDGALPKDDATARRGTSL